MYEENWENVFGEELDNTKIIGAKKCITLLSSPLWSVKDVQEFYKNGSIIPPKIPTYRNDKERNRDRNRHAGCSYRTRRELDEVAGDPEVVDKLIESGILELHKKWKYPKCVIEVSPFVIVHNPNISDKTYKLMEQIWAGKHPEAPYRLNLGALDELVYGEEGAREEKGVLLYGHLVGYGSYIPVRNRDGEFSHWTPRIV